jgi:tetratricopeptide (TPR) repeat protein/tRNA A-37 threonylcarbamoyl transferase component Bud32
MVSFSKRPPVDAVSSVSTAPMTGAETYTRASDEDLELAVATSRAEAALFAIATPVRFGRYLLLERVGAGAMGVVYAAHDPELDRKVAVKVLQLHASTDREQARGRLVREARALARLAHPNVVAVHDAGTVGSGRVYIAMEFVDGVTLTSFLAASPRPREVLEVLLQAGRGLAAAHQAGIVHRDFKPDNVMITGAQTGAVRVRVMDFGLARPSADLDRAEAAALDARLDTVSTRTGAIVGTPAYMAPEQMLGATADARADQFAFCVVAWEALCGGRPFAASSREASLIAIEAGSYATTPADGFARSLRAALRRGLAARPEDRFASMDALLVALERGPRRRRARIGAAIVGVVAVAAGGSVAGRARYVEAGCVATGQEIADVWSNETRAALEQAMLGLQVPFAASTWARVQPGLDAYAESWASARADVCRAHRLDDRLDDALVEQAEDCLADGRERLTALVDALREPDVPALRSASDAVAALPDPALCSDARELVTRRWTPPPREHPETLALAQRKLAEVRAILALGRNQAAHESTGSLLELADDTDWPVLQVQARLVAASASAKASHLDVAVVHAEEALQIAAAHSDDAGAGEALIGLVDIARQRSDYERAEGLAVAASALVARVEPTPGPRTVRLALTLSSLALATGRYDDAVTELERAQGIANDTMGPEHPLHATLLANLGRVHFRRGDLAAAEAALVRAAELRSDQLGPDHPEVGDVTGLLGAVLVAGGKTQRGQALLRQGLEIMESALGPDDRSLSTPLANLALSLDLDGKPREALPLMQRALMIDERMLGPDHHGVSRGLIGLATIEMSLAELDRAMLHAERALAIRERLFGAEHVEIAGALDIIAAVQHERGNFADALATFGRSVALREKHGPDTSDHAKSLGDLAMVRLSMGHLDEAEALDLRVLEVYRGRGTSGIPPALSQTRLAEVARRRNDLDAAEAWLARARASLLETAEAPFTALLLEDGMLAAARGRLRDAIRLHRRAYDKVALEVGLDTAGGVMARLALAEDLLATGAPDEAREHAEAALATIEARGVQARDRVRAQDLIARSRASE